MVVLVAFAGIAFEWRAEMWELMVWAFVVELVLVSMALMMLVAQWFAFVASPEMNRKKYYLFKRIVTSCKSCLPFSLCLSFPTTVYFGSHSLDLLVFSVSVSPYPMV